MCFEKRKQHTSASHRVEFEKQKEKINPPMERKNERCEKNVHTCTELRELWRLNTSCSTDKPTPLTQVEPNGKDLSVAYGTLWWLEWIKKAGRLALFNYSSWVLLENGWEWNSHLICFHLICYKFPQKIIPLHLHSGHEGILAVPYCAQYNIQYVSIDLFSSA